VILCTKNLNFRKISKLIFEKEGEGLLKNPFNPEKRAYWAILGYMMDRIEGFSIFLILLPECIESTMI